MEPIPQQKPQQASGPAKDPRLLFRQKLDSIRADFDKDEYARRIEELRRGVPAKFATALYVHALKCASHGLFEMEPVRVVAEALKSSLANKSAAAILKDVWNLPREKFAHGVSVAPDLILRNESDLRVLLPILKAGDLDKLEQEIITQDAGKTATRTRRSLASVISDFRSTERAGIELVADNHLERAERLVENIQKRQRTEPPLSPDDVRAAMTALHETPRAQRRSQAFREQFFYLADQAVRSIYKIQPYETQLVTAALMTDPEMTLGTRGRYAQVRTGEGKSLILALVSSYLSMAYGRVHVLTSNEYLAERDASKFRALFRSLGISNGSFSESSQSVAAGTFSVDVLYTTSKQMVFHLLDSHLEDQPFCHGNDPVVGLFDEADNVFVDLVQVLCRKAVKIPPIFSRESLLKILEIVEPLKDSDDAVSDTLVETTRAAVKEAAALPDKLLKVWMRSAIESFRKRRDFHYYVNKGKNEIQIVDQDNTGRIMENCQWGNGLHEFVHVRELPGLPKASGTVIELSHPKYIKQTYVKIFGFSGTFGWISERDELKTQFLLEGFDVPPYWPSQRVDEPLRFFASGKDLEAEVVVRAKQNLAQGAATLIIVDSIEKSKSVRAMLRDAGCRPQLLNDVDNHGANGHTMSEDDILREAGRPGAVTVATYLAGRGADIVPSEGTPYVDTILTAVTDNHRVEMQARGRAGRMGAQGKSALFVSADDPFFSGSRVPQTIRLVLKAAARDEQLVALLPPLVSFWREVAGVIDAIEREVVTRKEDQTQRVIEDGYLELCREMTTDLGAYKKFKRLGPESCRDVVQHVLNGPWVHLFNELKLDVDQAARAQRDLDIHDADLDAEAQAHVDHIFEAVFGHTLEQHRETHGDTPMFRYTKLVESTAKESLKKAICHRSVCAESSRIRRIADEALSQIRTMKVGLLSRALKMSQEEIASAVQGFPF